MSWEKLPFCRVFPGVSFGLSIRFRLDKFLNKAVCETVIKMNIEQTGVSYDHVTISTSELR